MVIAASVNITLCLCGLLMLAIVFWRPTIEVEAYLARERLVAAALLHGGSLACRAASYVPACVSLDPYHVLSVIATALDACSALALTACVLTDADGRTRLASRLTPLSAELVGWTVGPCAIAGAIDSLISGIETLGVSYAASLCICCLLLQREHERELARRESVVESAQAKVFAEQMSPHFLFNTLTSISSLCYSDPDAAAETVANLAGYLRGNIDALSSDEPIPFETELSHIRQYVALEQADPARTFSMEYDLAAKPFLIPPLTVQPLVENAVKHGALARADDQGQVRLSTEDCGKFVRVMVTDNGTGDEDVSSMDNQSVTHDGIGLKSVERRLSVYGGSLRVEFGKDGGRACMLVPREEGR